MRINHFIKATVILRQLGWDEKIEAGDFHAFIENPRTIPNAVYSLTSTESVGKTVTEWRKETGVNAREFFRVKHPTHTAAIVDSHIDAHWTETVT